MWSLIGKTVLAESAKNHFGKEDPYFEEVPASRLNRAFGKKTQKRRKATPPGLSENDAKVLTQVKRRAYRLDYCLFNLCGIQFGWSSVIAIIPFAGDIADALLALMVVKSCGNIDGDLPSRLRTQMLTNVVLDFLIGLVPFVGDLADAMYKCNSRNAVILEKYLRERGARALKDKERQPEPNVDASLPEEFDEYHNPTSGGQTNQGGQESGTIGDNTATKPQTAKKSQRNRPQSQWFGGSKTKKGDIEQGAA